MKRLAKQILKKELTNKILIFVFIFFLVIKCISKLIEIRNYKKTFTRLNKLFPIKNRYLKDLEIYDKSLTRMGVFSKKKDRCVLLITGFREVPIVFEKIIKKLTNDNIDYLSPRTVGVGKTFFQKNIKWQDWVITYIEAMKILEASYNNVDIIAHSTGCNIALLYICQMKWSCNIRHVILSGVYLIENEIDKMSETILRTPVIGDIISYLYPIGTKPIRENRLAGTDTINKEFVENGFYENSVPVESIKELWTFKNFRPKKINCDDLTLFWANDDRTIGNPKKQHAILQSIYGRKIKQYTFPLDNKSKSGHNIFEENNIIVNQVYDKIKEIIN